MSQGRPKSATDQALELATREVGVTDRELQSKTGSRVVAPMAALLKRCEVNGLLTKTSELREGRSIYRLAPNANPAQKRAIALPRSRRRRPPGETLKTALRLARERDGVTVSELVEALSSRTRGPMVRSIKCGVRRGALRSSGRQRNGEELYLEATQQAPETSQVQDNSVMPAQLFEQALSAQPSLNLKPGVNIPLDWVLAFNRAFETFVRELAASQSRQS